MANKPNYLSNLTDKFDRIKLSKYLHHKCFLNVAVLVVFAHLAVPAKASQNDSDGDGLSDVYELKLGLESYLSDTDGDEVKDSDEIGENRDSPLDTDKDGIIDALDYDDDNDGLPTFLESKRDSDKDGLLDYLDEDSDNDGIPDGEEAGVLNQDKNQDGVDDAFDIMREGAVDKNGDGIDDNVKLPDHNNDGKPDYLDRKYQNQKRILVKKTNPKKRELKKSKEVTKKIVKAEPKVDTKIKLAKVIITDKVKKTSEQIKPSTSTEATNIAKVDNMIINRHTDSDNDGLSNALEKILGTNHLSRDSDSDRVSDAIEIGMDINSPQDSDRDGIIDALDDDDDNDGILTKFEDLNKDSTAINDDTDADGVPNYLDANDDGDNLLTKAEGPSADSDGDGILDYLDKNDGIKDSSNQTMQANSNEIPDEPEIVVLFDGDASKVTEEDADFDDSPLQDDIVSSLNNLLKENTFENANNTSIDQAAETSNTESTKTSSKKATSHWNLF